MAGNSQPALRKPKHNAACAQGGDAFPLPYFEKSRKVMSFLLSSLFLSFSERAPTWPVFCCCCCFFSFFFFLNQRSKRSDIKPPVAHQGVILVPKHLGFLYPSWISCPAFISLFSSPSCFPRLRVQTSGPPVHLPLGRIQNRLEGSSGPLPLPSPQSQTLKPPPCNLKGNLFCNISSSFQLFKNLIL